jgi:hypothetical protein
MATEPSGILVPAYDRPGDLSDWAPALEAARYLWPDRLIVIANPGNGPGLSPDPAYVAGIDAVRRRCGIVVGYVHDCYNRDDFPEDDPPANCPRGTPIEQDMARWFSIYPRVSGIFVDQVDSGDADRAADLKKMVDDEYGKKWINFPEARAVTVLNPGSIPSMEFMTKTDPAIVVIQEQTFDYFRTNWPPPGWVRDREGGDLSGIPARRLAIIAHTPAPQNTPADVAMLVDVAQRYSIGSVYANHLVGSIYKPLSTQLPPLARRICQLRNKLGFPCQVVTLPVCAGSQVFAWARSRRGNVFARR